MFSCCCEEENGRDVETVDVNLHGTVGMDEHQKTHAYQGDFHYSGQNGTGVHLEAQGQDWQGQEGEWQGEWYEGQWADEQNWWQDEAWENEQAWKELGQTSFWVGDGFYFKINLTNQELEKVLGLTLTVYNGSELVVKSVKGRPGRQLSKDVKKMCPDTKVIRGDQIVAVNGIQGPADTLCQAMKDADYLEIDLYRVRQHSISCIKKGPLGLRIGHDFLTINKVHPNSIIGAHNKDCVPSAEVLVGSRLLDVNGITDAKAIMTKLKHAPDGEELCLTIQRPGIDDRR